MAAFMPPIRPRGRWRGARFLGLAHAMLARGRGDAVHGFGLTPLEARPGARIGTGEALRQAAAESISFETARTERAARRNSQRSSADLSRRHVLRCKGRSPQGKGRCEPLAGE